MDQLGWESQSKLTLLQAQLTVQVKYIFEKENNCFSTESANTNVILMFMCTIYTW